MARWNGRSRGNKLGYTIFVQLLRLGGLKPAYFLLYFVSWYYYWFVPSSTRPLRKLYQERLGLSRHATNRLVRKNIYNFGQSLIDKIMVIGNQNHKFTISRTGGHYLSEMADAGKGGILLSAHLGNWELAGHLLKRLNSVINIVMYDGEDEAIKQYLDQVTGPKSFNIIYIKEDMSHIYEMSAALQRNEFICMHADRYVEGSRYIEKAFLGASAKFPLGPFILASKLRAPVSFVFAMKHSTYAYHFYGFPPKVYAGAGMTGAEQMLEDYISLLEQQVKKYPDQWYNFYDFWG